MIEKLIMTEFYGVYCMLQLKGLDVMRPWEEALRDYLEYELINKSI